MKAMTEGVVLAPSEFSMTFALFPSMTATQELVVPRSIPTTAPFTSELHRTENRETERERLLLHVRLAMDSTIYVGWLLDTQYVISGVGQLTRRKTP